MSHLLIDVCCLAGFACLAMAMERHQSDRLGHALTARATRGLRAAGWAALLVALWLSVDRQGWILGLVGYSGHTSVAAGLVFGTLVVLERRSAR